MNTRAISLILTVALGILTGCNRALFNEQTRFAPGYSESKFKLVSQGMPRSDVVGLIGEPLQISTQKWSEAWSYSPAASKPDGTPSAGGVRTYNLFGKFTRLNFTEGGVVESTAGDYLQGDFKGLTKQQVLARIGEPTERVLTEYGVICHYTLPGKSGTYKAREVYLDASNRVSSAVAEMCYD